MKKYTIDEVCDIINSCNILIPVDKLFDENHQHITKKEYGKILLEELCKELKNGKR